MLPFFASAVLNGLPADAVKVPPFNYLKLFLSIGITTSTWQTRWIQGIEKSSQKTAHTHTQHRWLKPTQKLQNKSLDMCNYTGITVKCTLNGRIDPNLRVRERRTMRYRFQNISTFPQSICLCFLSALYR